MTQNNTEYSVMIIDDDEIDRYLLKRKLKELELEFQIVEKTNGQEALDFFVENEQEDVDAPEGYPPQVVFLDINMPLMNGWEFLREFSSLYEKARLENSIVVMFTSSNVPEDKARLHDFVFVKGYLLKGEFSAADLKGILKYL